MFFLRQTYLYLCSILGSLRGQTSMLQNWMKSRPAVLSRCSVPILKVICTSGKCKYLPIALQNLNNCGEIGNMRIVRVSEKCCLLQGSEHITQITVKLQYVSELRSSERSGKICMTYQLLCWEHQVRKARWREDRFGQERKLN